jgi:hypothetical protein
MGSDKCRQECRGIDVTNGPVRRRKGLVQRDLPEGEGIILYDPLADRAFLLNHTSAVIWDLCDGTCSPSDLVDQIVDAVSVSRASVEADVGRALQHFHQSGLLNGETRDPEAK